MLEVEIQKLTAAVEALTKVMQTMSLPTITINSETPTNSDKPRQRKPRVTAEEQAALVEAAKPVEKPDCVDQPLKDEPEEVVSDITAEDIKTLAMEISRADSSTRPIILGILGEHGAKTITQLDPKSYRAVHGRLLSLAHDIALGGEEV